MMPVQQPTPRSNQRRVVFDNRYEILGELGSGAFGTVYRAVDRNLGGEEVALKVLHLHKSESELAVGRLKSEVSLTRRLNSPYVVRIHDCRVSHDERLYFSMEVVSGPNLASLLSVQPHQRFSVSDAISILSDIARGIAHAHQAGVIHRDLKPANILITEDGRAKVADFSIARALAEQDGGLTHTGEALGTPHYMAPEQFYTHRVDDRADIYSFSLIGYELLVGERPFVATSYYALAEMHRETSLPDIQARCPGVPDVLRKLLERGAAKKPDDRPASMSDVVLALDEMTGKGVAASRAGGNFLAPWRKVIKEQLKKSRRAHRRFQLFVCITILVAFHLLAWSHPFEAHYLAAKVQSQVPYPWSVPIRLLLHVRPTPDDRVLLADLLSSIRGDIRGFIAEENAAVGLMRAGISAESIEVDGVPPIVVAIRAGSGALVKEFIERRAGLDWRGEHGESLVSYSLSIGQTLPAVLLFCSGLDWNSSDNFGRNPLHYAVNASKYSVANTLLRGDCNGLSVPPLPPNVQANDGSTMLHLLAKSYVRDQEYVFLNVDRAIFDLSLVDKGGRTFVWYAVSRNIGLLSLFLHRLTPSVVDQPDHTGVAPLQIASENGQKVLVRVGANPCIPRQLGGTFCEAVPDECKRRNINCAQ